MTETRREFPKLASLLGEDLGGGVVALDGETVYLNFGNFRLIKKIPGLKKGAKVVEVMAEMSLEKQVLNLHIDNKGKTVSVDFDIAEIIVGNSKSLDAMTGDGIPTEEAFGIHQATIKEEYEADVDLTEELGNEITDWPGRVGQRLFFRGSDYECIKSLLRDLIEAGVVEREAVEFSRSFYDNTSGFYVSMVPEGEKKLHITAVWTGIQVEIVGKSNYGKLKCARFDIPPGPRKEVENLLDFLARSHPFRLSKIKADNMEMEDDKQRMSAVAFIGVEEKHLFSVHSIGGLSIEAKIEGEWNYSGTE